ncbi:hypothetical protein DYB37_013566 [Aphanomyces astaci]|uniref:Uncharacterized protein n=1 Tax=Aphanomyces astaci TaxID=112090 RepID=A0A3R6X0R6_APHAT|nr:hypothetical protein DYB35_013973 [Aphanomyces astaci]RHZ14787.1 hypothetical protein DYB37_013566 [Aphanomyces astaci]
MASVFANTTSVESDFSILKWEKDEFRMNLLDLSLDGIFQAKQFKLLGLLDPDPVIKVFTLNNEAWPCKVGLAVLHPPNNQVDDSTSDILHEHVDLGAILRKPRSESMQDDMRDCELTRSNSPDFKYLHRLQLGQ